MDYAKNVQNNYDWNYYFEWIKGMLGAAPLKWEQPPVSAETFIENAKYLNIGENTFPKVKEATLNMTEGKYLEGVIVAGIGCITGDSLINTKDGVMRMDSIPEGAFVRSYDTNTKKVSFKQCSGTIEKGKRMTYLVIVEHYGHIRATDNHPFYTEDGWVQLKDLKIGQKVFRYDSFDGKIELVKIKSIEAFKEEPVYDLTVNDNHNFFANDILVHNSGKCFGPKTNIMMADETFKRADEIQVGDVIMGDDCTPRTVLRTMTGTEKFFGVIPRYGKPFLCTADHILPCKKPDGSIEHITVRDYKKLNRWDRRAYKMMKAPIERPDIPVPIDPYYFGLWVSAYVGDEVGVRVRDKRIIREVRSLGSVYGVNFIETLHQIKKPLTIMTPVALAEGGRNYIEETIRQIKRLKFNNGIAKIIPNIFIKNSITVRTRLLAGILDSVGEKRELKGDKKMHCTKRIITIVRNRRYAEQIVAIARSLGFTATMAKHSKGMQPSQSDPTIMVPKYAFQINIHGDFRKLCLLNSELHYEDSEYQDMEGFHEFPFKVLHRHVGKFYGFEIDRNHRFLIEDQIVAHNSYISQILGSYASHKLLCMKDPHDYYDLAKDKNIVIVNMGTSAAQAKNVVFTGMSNLIKDSQFFKQFNPDILRTELRFDERRIVILSGNSRETGPLGMNVYAAILDEAAFYRDYEGKDVAEAIYNTLQRRITSRFKLDGMLVMISSPNYEHDFIIEKSKDVGRLSEDGKPVNDRLYAMLSPTWRFQKGYYADEYQLPEKHFFFNQMNNSIVEHGEEDPADTAYIREENLLRDKKFWQIPVDFETSFRSNPEKAKRDFAAVPSLTVEGFFSNSRVIDEMANPDHENPIKEDGSYEFPVPYRLPHYIHLDLALNKGGRGDFAGFCFPAGTKVTMANGTQKSIEKIHIHEEVLTHTLKKRQVTELHFRPYTGTMYTITTADTKSVRCTSEHPFAVIKSKGIEWIEASKLKEGMTLVTFNGKTYDHVKLEDIGREEAIKVPVWNLGVKTDNTYIANNILVHNCMVHIDGWEQDENTLEYYPKIYVDLIERIGHDETGEINFEKIRQKIYDLQDSGFMIKTVSVDGFQCVTGDTIVMMSNFKKKKIEDIKVGESVRSRTIDGEYKENKVKRIWSTKDQEVVRVWLEHDKYIDCTKQHAFLMRDGTYSPVESMSVGDELTTIFAGVYWRIVCIDTIPEKKTVWDMELEAPHNFVTGVGVIAHNSADMQQILKSKGINTEYVSADRTLEPYMTLKTVINMKRLDIYKYPPLEHELKQLELVKGKKVDHPKSGSKDLADALSCSIYTAIKDNMQGAGWI